MMISPWVHDALLYGAIAALVGAIFVFYARDAPAKVPAATALGSRRHALWRAVRRIAPWLGLAVGAVGAVYVYVYSSKVVLVTDDGGIVEARRMIYLGGDPPGAAGWTDPHSSPTWVVNDSSRELRVETVQYGQALFDSDPSPIPPHTVKAYVDIDHVGPDDRPPASVEDRYNLHMEQRSWLTWD